MSKYLCFILLSAGIFNACPPKKGGAYPQIAPKFHAVPPSKPEKNEITVLIHTSYGDMKARLFNETPKHRDNFVKLVEKKFYDSLLFHRVIKKFMIQGGDPDSRNAEAGKVLGDGGTGYTVPAEFVPAKLFHRKGMLAAAREGDDVNPSKESSACQFYIVQGKIQDDVSLEKYERRINANLIKKISDSVLALAENKKLKTDFDRIKTMKADSVLITQKKIDELVDPIYKKTLHYKIPETQRKIYKSIGGTPHLDTHYTIFGEVYEGLEVLDKIAESETDENNRPKADVKMSITILRKP